MLKVDRICKAYGKQIVLQDTCLEVDSEIKVLLGVNGCGKSTLLKIIAGIVSPNSGSVILNDQNITALPPEKRRVGYVPQHAALFNHLSVKQNITYGMRDGHGTQELLSKITVMLGLQKLLDKKPGELSGGYKSRVSLARALAPQPLIMLLDEPLSDIDVVVKERLLPEFRQVIDFLQIPAIYVTHDPAEAEQVGDTFSIIVKGQVSQTSSAAQALSLIRTYSEECIDD